MRNFAEEFTKVFGKERLLLNEILARYTTMRLGGTADYFFRAKKTEELVTAVRLALKYEIKYTVIGGGTNLLVTDKGYRGLVIKNETANIKFRGVRGGRLEKNKLKSIYNTVFLEVDSGIGINRLVRYAIDQGYGGLESFLGQPGTVGGAVWINAHNISLNKFIGELCAGGKVLTKKGEIIEVDNGYFKFDYDHSSLQSTNNILLTAIFKLNIADKEKMWQEATQVLNYRKNTQPQGTYSAGCVFRNISKSEALRLATPGYTVSTGYLIDSLRLKGYKIGNAQISESHGNFIINKGQAKTQDVMELLDFIKLKVFERFGVKLKEEISILGEQ